MNDVEMVKRAFWFRTKMWKEGEGYVIASLDFDLVTQGDDELECVTRMNILIMAELQYNVGKSGYE